VAQIIEHHNQRDQTPSPSPTPSMSSSTTSSESDGETVKQQRPARRVRRTQKLVDDSQTTKDIAASKAPKRRKPGKKALAAAVEMSQLPDGYIPPPSRVVLLDTW
jgi:hypothetical protein